MRWLHVFLIPVAKKINSEVMTVSHTMQTFLYLAFFSNALSNRLLVSGLMTKYKIMYKQGGLIKIVQRSTLCC